MASAYNQAGQRPREWRRRVSIRARVRSGSDWSDCHILNISSRGMLLRYSRPLGVGSAIEIRQEGRKVPATVIWREGNCAGLACDHPIDTIDWVAVSTDRGAVAKPVTAQRLERRVVVRESEDWRLVARKFQHVAITGLASVIAIGVAASAVSAVLEPLATVTRVLG